MQRLMLILGGLVLSAGLASQAAAQADAQAAYQQAKTAYAAGRWTEARDLAQRAIGTDPKNPEISLLLGKAQYQLGAVDEALAAWKKTLALAPEEPYAARMIEALQSQRTDVDTRVRLVETLLAEGLPVPAGQQCRELLAMKTLSEAQRAKVMTLLAEATLATHSTEALRIIREVQVLYPKQADPLQTRLIEGLAKLAEEESARVAEGVAILKDLVEKNAKTPAAATAQGALLIYQAGQSPRPEVIGELAQWLAANPKHPRSYHARMALLAALLAQSAREAPARPDSPLTQTDLGALSAVREAIGQTVRTAEIDALVGKMFEHLESHYVSRRAFAAAVAGTEQLAAMPLPHASRVRALRAVATYKFELAMQRLEEAGKAGRLATMKPLDLPRDLPADLLNACSAFDAVNQASAANGAWTEQAAAAERVRALAAYVPQPDRVTALRAPETWAVAIALGVNKVDADVEAVKRAAALVFSIADEYVKIEQPSARALGLSLSHAAADILSPTHPAWADFMLRYAATLDAAARRAMIEAANEGRAVENAKLSDVQKELIDVLGRVVAKNTAQAPAALDLIRGHLKAWTDQGHWSVAEEAYTALAKNLPPEARRAADLAIVRLWIEQVFQRDRRLASVGLTVPRALDPVLKKALVRCYELQEGLEPKSPKLEEVRLLSNAIVSHYRRLDYDDVAEAALKVKAEKAVEAADQYAEFQLILFNEFQARRELARTLAQYGAAEKIALTPALKTTLAAWTKWIVDRPTNPLTPLAIERVLGIARLYEQQGAFDIAAGVYADFAKAAAAVKPLAQPSPVRPSTAEQAQYMAACALDRQAAKVLGKALAERKPDDPPPAALSAEYAATLAAYKSFLEAYPKSSFTGDVLRRLMAVGLEYAKVDAWDVAEGVYADLGKSKLSIQRPERLDFAQGLCQLGRAMGPHAREVLTGLCAAGLGAADEKRDGGPEQLAFGFLGHESTLRDFETDSDKLAYADDSVLYDKRQAGGEGGGGFGNGLGTGPGGPRPGERPAGDPASRPSPVLAPPASQPMPTKPEPAKDDPFGSPNDESRRDSQLLAMIQRQEANRSARVAQMRENLQQQIMNQAEEQQGQQASQVQRHMIQAAAVPALSEAELARIQKALDAAYAIFQSIRKDKPTSPTAQQARAEILVMVGHWRSLAEWQRSAALAGRFLADNPTDAGLPQLRLEVAKDRLSWAAKPIARQMTRQELLAEVASRFTAARDDFSRIIADFPKERGLQHAAQWEVANSFLTEARTIGALSPTLARGQFVRAARELRAIAQKYPNHPQIGSIGQMLWQVSQELESRGYAEEAIVVWNELAIYDPAGSLAQQAMAKIAYTYHVNLKRPLKAAETYLELNFIRGGSDQASQDAVFQIGTALKGEKRWVEALHVLETFVDSFPRHAQAGQALTMIGQIHQTNEAWQDAINAYRRVIAEYKEGQWVQDAKWSIAECTINLSQWREAMAAYRGYVAAYPGDSKVSEANRRIEILKDLARYQGLVDEKGQRKAFDAQYQIAKIVHTQLGNPVKAIIEYRKVVKNWPDSYVAASALNEIGTAYVALGEMTKAREALEAVARDYPTSPLAGAALFMVGKSYEDEADRLATVTRERTLEKAREQAQRGAYEQAQSYRQKNLDSRNERISGLKAAGKGKAAELEEASGAFNAGQFSAANAMVFAQKAAQDVEMLTASQLADRQDKINAALRKAIEAYTAASKVPGGNKADAALLQMANIYDQRLKDSKAAMETWLEIVRQFSGTSVAEDASWKLAQYYEREGKYAQAIEAYNSFLRNYRRSPNAGAAQFAVAECYEHLGQWIAAMDSYNNYINNFADGPLVGKAKEQINWIKTYRL